MSYFVKITTIESVVEVAFRNKEMLGLLRDINEYGVTIIDQEDKPHRFAFYKGTAAAVPQVQLIEYLSSDNETYRTFMAQLINYRKNKKINEVANYLIGNLEDIMKLDPDETIESLMDQLSTRIQ